MAAIAKSENKTDKKIENILNIINKSDDYYTSSSCSGRIVLIELPEIGDKKEAKFLGKWHREILRNELEIAVKKSFANQSEVNKRIKAKEKALMDLAGDNLLKMAFSCGFKNSGYKSICGKRIVEICSTERLDTPIGNNGILFCNKEFLNLLVDISNDIIIRSNKKIIRLEKELKNI